MNEYKVKRVNGNLNKAELSSLLTTTERITLTHFMGEKPLHFPMVTASLLYSDEYLHLRFNVDDKYVVARNSEHMSSVCKDSCVEFFFVGGTDISNGYFNLEMNCIGTLLMNHQIARGVDRKNIATDDLDSINTKTNLAGVIDPEIAENKNWFIEAHIPFTFLSKYSAYNKPESGVKWLANFYKCADKCSHPHWLTWNKVESPKPDFHRPEYFGTLEFE